MLFADSSLSPAFRAQWFSWANPAETMLAYAELATKQQSGGGVVGAGGVYKLRRLLGASARRERPAFRGLPGAPAPIKETVLPMPLDESHMHRLETVDRALYARLWDFRRWSFA